MSSSTWTRLIRRWETLRPDLPRGGLNEPATERQIEIVESLIGMRFPADLREAYLHINGNAWAAWVDRQAPFPNVIPGSYRGHWMSLHEVVCRWGQDRVQEAGWEYDRTLGDDEEEPGEPARLLYFHPGWLPVGRTYSQPTVYVDLAPTQWGHSGQVLMIDPGCGPKVMARSFGALVDGLLDDIEVGRTRWNGSAFVNAVGEEL